MLMSILINGLIESVDDFHAKGVPHAVKQLGAPLVLLINLTEFTLPFRRY